VIITIHEQGHFLFFNSSSGSADPEELLSYWHRQRPETNREVKISCDKQGSKLIKDAEQMDKQCPALLRPADSGALLVR
jgi:hypothetical protein